MKSRGSFFNRMKRHIRRASEMGPPAVILFLFLFLAVLSVPAGKISEWHWSTVVTDRQGTPLQGYLSEDGEWSLPVPIEEMGKWMPKVAVALEDRRFFSHQGVDGISILRALAQNIKAGRTISGGSTITMQLIRLSVPRARTLSGKMAESWQAIQLERLMTKKDILELYLNKAPFGSNIRGVEAAARAWFDKPAKELSLSEAVTLAGLMRGPAPYRPDRYPDRTLALRDRLLERLALLDVASSDEIRRAKLEPVPGIRFPIPSSCAEAARHACAEGSYPGSREKYGRIRSSIDLRMQNIVEGELRLSLSGLPREITAAAVIVENGTGLVRAYVGNMRKGEGGPASWVDCGSSPRSPGSLLKPFVYALAFESGELIPSSILADTPMSMGQTAPRNFDRIYRGPVSVRTALVESLNVPAVRVLRRVGPNRALDFYRRVGFVGITKDAGWYGDSLVLGGCEVTLLEAAEAYHTLAVLGKASVLGWREGVPSAKKEEVLSAGASALVLDILKDERRLIPLYRELFDDEENVIAFKTGTSHGLRDAWTAAVTKTHTLVVWFGDPTGKPHRSLVGIMTAAPPAVQILRKITPRGTGLPGYPPEVKQAEICPLSGAPPSSACPKRAKDIFIQGVSSREPCRLHVMGDNGPEVKWPPEIELFFSGSENARGTSSIEIGSPRNDAVYRIGTDKNKILLSSRGGKGKTYWFADGEFVPSGEGQEKVWWEMKEGNHKISAADAFGNSAHVRITVIRGNEKKEENLPTLEEIRRD